MFVCVCVSVYTLVWPNKSNEDCLYECDQEDYYLEHGWATEENDSSPSDLREKNL